MEKLLPAPKPIILLSLLSVLIFVLAWGGPGLAQEDYVLGPEDVIDIQVWDHGDLNRSVRVGLDGRISYPFVGELKVQGLTVLQVQKALELRLADGYIVDPPVHISVKEYKSQKFYAMGAVGKSGSHPLTRNISLVTLSGTAMRPDRNEADGPNPAAQPLRYRAFPPAPAGKANYLGRHG